MLNQLELVGNYFVCLLGFFCLLPAADDKLSESTEHSSILPLAPAALSGIW